MMFVSVWAAVLEISTGRGLSCNAGHENPGLRREGRGFELLKYRHGMVLGATRDATYENREFELRPGDCVFVYTDGVPEAANTTNVLFGTDRLQKTLNEDAGAAPEELIRRVHAAVSAFADSAPQFDDITMLCVKYNGEQDG
jgi:sigma-B regulation protein RsbU (phosphoserine phosphatase)